MDSPVPPNDVDAEMATLGSMMLDPRARDEALILLQHEDFYIQRRQELFKCLSQLASEGVHGDEIVLANEMKKRGWMRASDSTKFLADIIERTPGTANAGTYCRIVRDKALARVLLETCERIIRKIYEMGGTNARELIEWAHQQLFDLLQDDRIDEVDWRQVIKEVGDEVERVLTSNLPPGIPTGLVMLDREIGGLRKAEIYYLAGRPGHGKSSLLTQVCHSVAEAGHSVLIVSSEVAARDVARNIIFRNCGISVSKMNRGELTQEDGAVITKELGRSQNLPLTLVDRSDISIDRLRAIARRHAARNELDLIAIDYVQLLTAGRRMEKRHEEVAHVSRQVKAMAKELDVPVFGAVQLSRAVEGRTKKHPILSDLGESAQLERDADTVMLIGRPIKWGVKGADENDCNLHIAKNRMGPTPMLKLTFQPEITMFKERSSDEQRGDVRDPSEGNRPREEQETLLPD